MVQTERGSNRITQPVSEVTPLAKSKDTTFQAHPERYSIAIYKLPDGGKNCYAHTCKDCGGIRFFNMKRITAVRCWPCRVRFMGAYPKRAPAICSWCGARCRGAWRSKRTTRFCSVRCHNLEQRERGQTSAVKRTCKHCRKEFWVAPSGVRKRAAESCSNSCRVAHHVYINCAHCGQRFNARHNTTRRFCSKRCYLSSWTESRIERRVRATLETYRLIFETQYPVKGAHHFDFYVPSLNLLIEADGTYWHSRPWSEERDAKKTARAAGMGYQVERFPESLIMSAGWPKAFHAVIAQHLQRRGNNGRHPRQHKTATGPVQGLLRL